MKLLVKKLHKNAFELHNDHADDFGLEIGPGKQPDSIGIIQKSWDRYRAIGTVIECRTGLAVCCSSVVVEDEGHSATVGFRIFPRVSVETRGWHLLGGTIDPGYRGEIKIRARYMGHTSEFDENMIKPGERVGRLVPILAYPLHEIETVNELPTSDRGELGFGSGGR